MYVAAYICNYIFRLCFVEDSKTDSRDRFRKSTETVKIMRLKKEALWNDKRLHITCIEPSTGTNVFTNY